MSENLKRNYCIDLFIEFPLLFLEMLVSTWSYDLRSVSVDLFCDESLGMMMIYLGLMNEGWDNRIQFMH